MSILNKLASSQDRKDALPNKELAKELANHKNAVGIREIAQNLWNKDKNIRSDCIKVLYEIGYIDPELISDHMSDFLKLIRSHNNRLVWGGMIALSTIAETRAEEIFDHLEEIINTIKKGSVITIDSGIKTLSLVASTKKEYCNRIFPFLMEHLQNCRPKDVPMRAEFIISSVDADNKQAFVNLLNERSDILRPAQLKRIQKLLDQLENL